MVPYSHSSTIDTDVEKVVAACCFTTPAAGGLHLRQPVLLGLVAQLSYQLLNADVTSFLTAGYGRLHTYG